MPYLGIFGIEFGKALVTLKLKRQKKHEKALMLGPKSH